MFSTEKLSGSLPRHYLKIGDGGKKPKPLHQTKMLNFYQDPKARQAQ